MSTLDIGNHAEALASDYLIQQGLTLITKNYRCKLGEIDLIMQEADTRVFIEVRFRTNIYFGSPAATVNRAKQAKIIKTAKYYLVCQQLYDKIYCRFDVVTVIPGTNSNDSIEWIKNAFIAP